MHHRLLHHYQTNKQFTLQNNIIFSSFLHTWTEYWILVGPKQIIDFRESEIQSQVISCGSGSWQFDMWWWWPFSTWRAIQNSDVFAYTPDILQITFVQCWRTFEWLLLFSSVLHQQARSLSQKFHIAASSKLAFFHRHHRNFQREQKLFCILTCKIYLALLFLVPILQERGHYATSKKLKRILVQKFVSNRQHTF